MVRKKWRFRRSVLAVAMAVLFSSSHVAYAAEALEPQTTVESSTEQTMDGNTSEATNENVEEDTQSVEASRESSVEDTEEVSEEKISKEGTSEEGNSTSETETEESQLQTESSGEEKTEEVCSEGEILEEYEESTKPHVAMKLAAEKNNAVSQSSEEKKVTKIVDASGNEVSKEDAKKIDDLLKSLEKAEGFAIYGEELDRTNHIEGNISVNDITAGYINITTNQVTEKTDGDYSYVGNTNGGIQITDNSTIIVGADVPVYKPNGNQTVINGGYSNNIAVTQLTSEGEQEKREEIRENLKAIADAGLAAKKEVDEAFYNESGNAFESVNGMLKDNVLNKGDIVSINVDYKNILNNEGAFGNLVNNNNGTTVIVNIILTEEDVTDITIFKAFTANTNISTAFNSISPYIIWNFGDYKGKININEEMVGIIVAPEAQVYQAAGNLNGQIISKIAGNNGEIHQVTRGREEIPTEEESSSEEESSTEPQKTDDPTDETPSTPPKTPEKHPTPINPLDEIDDEDVPLGDEIEEPEKVDIVTPRTGDDNAKERYLLLISFSAGIAVAVRKRKKI